MNDSDEMTVEEVERSEAAGPRLSLTEETTAVSSPASAANGSSRDLARLGATVLLVASTSADPAAFRKTIRDTIKSMSAESNPRTSPAASDDEPRSE